MVSATGHAYSSALLRSVFLARLKLLSNESLKWLCHICGPLYSYCKAPHLTNHLTAIAFKMMVQAEDKHSVSSVGGLVTSESCANYVREESSLQNTPCWP